MNKKTKLNTLIGIDYGGTNIGLSMGRKEAVAPLKIISGKNIDTAIHEITRIAFENKADGFVIGLPLNADGKETRQSLQVRKFSKLLKVYIKKPVIFYNEYGSTQDALMESISTGVPMEKRRTNDHIAAAMILKNYFSSEKETA